MTQRQNGSICAEEYVVKRGDSFYLIAHKLGVPLRDLLAANRDIHPARLMVGDVLCIPREEDDRPQTGGTAAPAPDAPSLDSGSSGSGNAGNSGANGSGNAGNSGANGSGSSSSAGNSSTGSSGNNSSAGNSGANGSGSSSSAGSSGSGNSGATSPGSNGNTGSSASPDASPTPVPAPACPLEEQVTVRPGETVADIQLQSLLSRNTLQTANPSVDLDALRAGQTLCVPAENTACTLPSTYTLVEGETLESVAMRFNLPLGSLLRVNPCLAPQDFEEGVTVILPR
ncbi:MAG: LysM peptidoglycan-binding domain-containing protein [Clostridiales bacterium]|nr:LysM peptidoglycan-binding domain-containing protein [Clostridiales bacterium]